MPTKTIIPHYLHEMGGGGEGYIKSQHHSPLSLKDFSSLKIYGNEIYKHKVERRDAKGNIIE